MSLRPRPVYAPGVSGGRTALAVLLLVGLGTPAFAQPKSWYWEGEETSARAGRRVRFSPRFNFWASTFKRPPRACRAVPLGAPRAIALRAEQFPVPGFSCNVDSSSELGFGSGFEFAFRTIGPLYLTAGVDFVYTEPDGAGIKNQLILSMPFGVLFTWYEWFLRPIAYFQITPVLYVSDDSRDYTFGGGGGLAYRIGDFGSISASAGYHFADSLTGWQVQIGVHPIF